MMALDLDHSQDMGLESCTGRAPVLIVPISAFPFVPPLRCQRNAIESNAVQLDRVFKA